MSLTAYKRDTVWLRILVLLDRAGEVALVSSVKKGSSENKREGGGRKNI